MADIRRKHLLASVEQSGDTTGDYAQLTSVVLKDLQQNKGLFKNVKSIKEVKSNPELYDQVVEAYWNRMDDFGINNNIGKTLWWRAPGEFLRTQGDISKIKDPRLKNVMSNRVTNLRAFIQGPNTSAISEALAGRL